MLNLIFPKVNRNAEFLHAVAEKQSERKNVINVK